MGDSAREYGDVLVRVSEHKTCPDYVIQKFSITNVSVSPRLADAHALCPRARCWGTQAAMRRVRSETVLGRHGFYGLQQETVGGKEVKSQQGQDRSAVKAGLFKS